MSDKEKVDDRLVISPEKHKEWENRFIECFDEMRSRIRGQLLTTMEIAFPEGIKLEALKSRIRDVQNKVWNKIYDAHNRRFRENFSVAKGEVSEKPNFDEYKKKVETFFLELDRVININIGHFNKLIDNLVVLAEECPQKQEALKEAAKGITDEVYWGIRAWIEGTIREVFEIK